MTTIANPVAECPLCHTVEAAPSRLGAQQEITWKCARCGQRWDSYRLTAVAAHQQWLALGAPTSPA